MSPVSNSISESKNSKCVYSEEDMKYATAAFLALLIKLSNPIGNKDASILHSFNARTSFISENINAVWHV
jgi:hypothetical protein